MVPYIILLLLFSVVESGKVGIFVSTFSNSQLVFGFRLAEELLKEHEVVIIRPELNPKTKEFGTPGTKNLKQIRIELFNDTKRLDDLLKIQQDFFFREFSVLEKNMRDMRSNFVSMMDKACDRMLSDENFLKSIEKENFDVVFVHHYDLCLYGIAHIAKVPKTILAISSPVLETLTRIHGHLSPPSLIPSVISNFSMDMTISERFKNFVLSVAQDYSGYSHVREYQQVFDRKFKNFPDIRDLIRGAKLIFVNDFEVLDYPRPILSKIINIGGIGMNLGGHLESDLKTFVENSKNPTVLVSLGTVTDSKYVPEKWKNEFVKFFEENPEINFIWKFEDEHLKLPKNVIMKKWIPQVAVLKHEKTIAFLSHCGYNGVQETIFTGVPILCVPLFVDQFRNAKLVEYRGFGKSIAKSSFYSASLTKELKEVIQNSSYKESALNLRKLINSRPFNSSELLLRWTKFAIENDFDLTPPYLDVIRFYNLDFLIPLGFISLVVLSFILRTIFRLYYWSCCTMAFKDKQKLQ